MLIVAYLMYLIYKLLKGTLAFNIFIGVALLYVVYLLVIFLDMKLLSLVLGKFVGFGVIILIIIFQPEVRRFLLILGNSTLKGRLNFLNRFLGDNVTKDSQSSLKAAEIGKVLVEMSEEKTGALIVISDSMNVEAYKSSGVLIDAELNAPLLKSIFSKFSPLHDGAVIISGGRIVQASTVLPVSDSMNLPQDIGLRHRAAVGISENTNFAAFVVSEETGKISYAFEGVLYREIDERELNKLLKKHLG